MKKGLDSRLCGFSVILMTAACVAACSQTIPDGSMINANMRGPGISAGSGLRVKVLENGCKGRLSLRVAAKRIFGGKHCIQFEIVRFQPTRRLLHEHLLVNRALRQANSARPSSVMSDSPLTRNSSENPCYSASSDPSGTVVVGAPFSLAACLYIDYYPVYVYDCDWSGVPNSAVSSYTVSDSLSESTPVNTDTNDNVLVAYFTQSGTTKINVTCLYEYNSYGSGSYNWPSFPLTVTEPTAHVSVTYGNIAFNTKYPDHPYDTLHWGINVIGSEGINWTYSVSKVSQSGELAVFQTIQNDTIRPHAVETTPPGQICADLDIPFEKQKVSTDETLQYGDAPVLLFGPNKAHYYGNTSFNTTFWDAFMYKPDTPASQPNGIWVRLAYLKGGWSWQGSGNYSLSNGWTWIQQPQLTEPNPTYQDGLPQQWTCPYQ